MSTQTSSDSILVSVENQIKTITINQPQKKNAISNEMAYRLKDIILESQADDCRVIVLTGAGSDFSAGADLDPNLMDGATGTPFDVGTFLRSSYNPMVLAMRNMNKPIIAKVRGICVGAAFSFVLACDIIYVSETARFSQIFTRIGLSSDGGGGYFMAQKIGYHKAFELMATNAMISAGEADNLGLVNRVFVDDELDAAVDKMAKKLAGGPYLAIQHTKSNVRAGHKQTLAEALEQEAQNQAKNFSSRDFYEGVAAFLEKRKAEFKGE